MVGGRYRLVAELGSGGFGRVWRAWDEALGVEVAIKEVWLLDAASETERAERLKRAEREARNAARLRDHRNIVAVHDVVVEDGSPWIVMRLVDGASLEQRISVEGHLPVDKVREIAVGVLRALNAAQQAGIAHRDVKPANVLLTGDGQVLLTDFGIAVHEADTALTAKGMLIGTVEYTAPERLNDRGDQGTTSDLFSLGATLYAAVEGRSPFRRDTHASSMAAVLFEQAPPPQHADTLTALITGLLEKDPEQRLTISEALALADPPLHQQQTTTHNQETRRMTRRVTAHESAASGKALRIWVKTVSLLVAAAVVLFFAYVAMYLWVLGGDASGAKAGDCLWFDTNANRAKFHYTYADVTKTEPCSLPFLLPGNEHYVVLERITGTTDPTVCSNVPGAVVDNDTSILVSNSPSAWVLCVKRA